MTERETKTILKVRNLLNDSNLRSNSLQHDSFRFREKKQKKRERESKRKIRVY